MKPMLKRIKAIERRMPPNPEIIEYTTMSPAIVEKLEALIGRKMTDDEKRTQASNEPLSPESAQKLKDLQDGVK